MSSLNSLVDFSVEEVSLVDRGANKKKSFPLWKGAQGKGGNMPLNKIIKDVLETASEAETAFDAWCEKQDPKLDEKAHESLRATLRLLSANKDIMPADALGEVLKMAGLAPTPAKDPDPKPDPKPAPTQKKDKDDPPMSDDIKKALATRDAAIEALTKQNELVAASLLKMEETQAQGAWIAKAEKDLSHFPGGSAEDLGASLYAIEKAAGTEAADKQFTIMKSASVALKKSGLLKPAGTPGSDEIVKAADQIMTLVEGMVEKSGYEATPQASMLKLMKSRKGHELYKDYARENPDQFGSRIPNHMS